MISKLAGSIINRKKDISLSILFSIQISLSSIDWILILLCSNCGVSFAPPRTWTRGCFLFPEKLDKYNRENDNIVWSAVCFWSIPCPWAIEPFFLVRVVLGARSLSPDWRRRDWARFTSPVIHCNSCTSKASSKLVPKHFLEDTDSFRMFYICFHLSLWKNGLDCALCRFPLSLFCLEIVPFLLDSLPAKKNRSYSATQVDMFGSHVHIMNRYTPVALASFAGQSVG